MVVGGSGVGSRPTDFMLTSLMSSAFDSAGGVVDFRNCALKTNHPETGTDLI